MNDLEKCVYLQKKKKYAFEKKFHFIDKYFIPDFNNVDCELLKVWDNPSFKANIYHKIRMQEHEKWKQNLAKDPWYTQNLQDTDYEKNILDIDANFGIFYDIIDTSGKILHSFNDTIILSWEKHVENDTLYWVNISKKYQLWMPVLQES